MNENNISAVLRDLVAALRELRQPSGPELLSAKQAAQLCGLSVANWWRRHSAGEVPAPVRIGQSTRWRRAELAEWIGAGCPARKIWEHK